ncbi:MAG: TetR/AcrR family transcriptional regulator [Pseudomonadota bacterium]
MDASTPQEAKKRPATRDAERTRGAILSAATVEFTAQGFSGGSVNEVAARAGVNKRMIYHYFGNKEGLYLAVLEATYAGIRSAEYELDLSDLEPREAMRRLVTFTFDYFIEHPEFLSLLNTENMHKAQHLKKSEKIRQMHSPLVGMIEEILQRGERDGAFRSGVDPVQLYISIAALGFFYLSNQHTLSTIFGRDLAAPPALTDRREHTADVILGYLR